jgi:hypothetical protein
MVDKNEITFVNKTLWTLQKNDMIYISNKHSYKLITTAQTQLQLN